MGTESNTVEYVKGKTAATPDTKTPDLRNGHVKTPDLKNGDIKTSELQNGDVKMSELQNGDVKMSELQNGGIKMSHLKNGDIKTSDFGNGDVKTRVANGTTKIPSETEFPSIIEIKKTIPPHCFEPSISRSLYYAAKDLFLIAILYFASERMWQVFPEYVAATLTPLYWLLQGTLMWAVFVVGHDCGHDSFSKNTTLNDVVGTALHTMVFAPYYCWKLSHRHHHKNTGNIDKDEVFYPIRSDDNKGMQALPGFGLGIAWFIYLATGYHNRPVCHFNPFDSLFKRHVIGCAISVASIAIWCLALYRYVEAYGAMSFVYHYAVPLFVSTTYLVIVTFLHHTEFEVPWYADSEWKNVKGQISSVDRDYGWCHELTHNIGTHQIHHLFPKIPHYHLEEATRHFRKSFPDLVYICNEPIIPSFIRMFKTFVKQHVIGRDVVIHIYKK